MTTFQLSSSVLQMTIVLHPSRTRHNGDTCADMQQGPAQRFLFRLRPCVNLFYCLLLIHIPRILSTTEKEAGVLACGHVRICAYVDTRGFLPRALFSPFS